LLLLIAGSGASLGVAFAHPYPLVLLPACAVVAGAWLPRQKLSRVLLPMALGAAGAAAVLSSVAMPASGIPVALHAFGGACLVLGFGLLPHALIHGAVHAARRSERARADAEIVKLVEEARLFRRIGRIGADGDRGALQDVSEAVAQRERLYRLLQLVERAVPDLAVIAVYAVDDAGTGLDLVEQLARVGDVETPTPQNHARLSLAGRGTGTAGVVGLCVKQRVPLRVVDATGAAVRAHRASGPAPASVLAVPLLGDGGTLRGAIVLDRLAPRAFDAQDEAFTCALAAEVIDGLATERLVADLDAARRRVARVSAATRALTGVSRTVEVVEQTLRSVGGLCAGVAIVRTGPPERSAKVLAASGPLAPLARFVGLLDEDSFGARALAEHVPLPHTALDDAAPRRLLSSTDPLPPGAVGDLRTIPLSAHGETSGLLIVAVPPGERLRGEVIDAVVAIADVLALALVSAAAFEEVERQATTDGLTGVWNRRSLDHRLQEAVARVRRNGQPLCVILTDVDHFKSVNDTWGHGTGDDVLKGVAQVLVSCARTTDVVGRLGGEEFVVVCEGTDLSGALIVAERMRTAIKARVFQTAKGPLSVTSSFGVALLAVDDTDHAVLERADQHLYRAKQLGRDRVVGV
jgi:diguanylate cyclase (GGDEF)-like protein